MRDDLRQQWRKMQEPVCRSKVSYPSRAAARGVLDRVRRRRQGITKEHRPYQCPVCFHWHIGNAKR